MPLRDVVVVVADDVVGTPREIPRVADCTGAWLVMAAARDVILDAPRDVSGVAARCDTSRTVDTAERPVCVDGDSRVATPASRDAFTDALRPTDAPADGDVVVVDDGARVLVPRVPGVAADTVAADGAPTEIVPPRVAARAVSVPTSSAPTPNGAHKAIATKRTKTFLITYLIKAKKHNVVQGEKYNKIRN